MRSSPFAMPRLPGWSLAKTALLGKHWENVGRAIPEKESGGREEHRHRAGSFRLSCPFEYYVSDRTLVHSSHENLPDRRHWIYRQPCRARARRQGCGAAPAGAEDQPDSTTLKASRQRPSSAICASRSRCETAVSGCDAVMHVAADYRLWVRDPKAMYAANVGRGHAICFASRRETRGSGVLSTLPASPRWAFARTRRSSTKQHPSLWTI